MSDRQKKWFTFLSPALLVVVLDQWSKFVIRTTPELHRETLIEGWLSFTFTKNPGMAMGIDLLPTPVISVIAVLATIAITAYVWWYIDRSNLLYLTCMGLVVGGALGNILDRIFMGLIGGYGGIFDGHVVDFIHFTLEIADRPVFPYIFNVADIAISVSIILMLLFHKTILPDVNGTEGGPGNDAGSEGDGGSVNGSEGELVDGK